MTFRFFYLLETFVTVCLVVCLVRSKREGKHVVQSGESEKKEKNLKATEIVFKLSGIFRLSMTPHL